MRAHGAEFVALDRILRGKSPVFESQAGKGEVLDRAGEPGTARQIGEFGEDFDSRTGFAQALQHVGATISDAGDKSEAGDNNPFFQATRG